jgi:hypothetical protein
MRNHKIMSALEPCSTEKRARAVIQSIEKKSYKVNSPDDNPYSPNSISVRLRHRMGSARGHVV